MIGMILKLWLFILGLLVVVLVILNLTGVFKPGTLSFSKPDATPCEKIAATYTRKPHVVEVRWIWNPKSYGWGCYFEYDVSTSQTITPMPK